MTAPILAPRDTSESGLDLPEGWQETSLDALLASLESGSRPKGGVRGIKEGVPSIGGEHLDERGGFRVENVKFVPRTFFKTMNRGHISLGDVLVVKDGATTGKVALVRSDFPYPEAVVNEHVFICRPTDAVHSTYLFMFLFSAEGQERILENFQGSAQGGINQGFARGTIVPLAPLAEQKRIVAKVEELLPRVNAARERLARVPAILKRFRQAVLAAACEGRLTEEWRKTALNSESAAALLNRLLTVRRSQWAAPRQRRYPDPSAPAASLFDSLPEGWVEATVSQLAWLDVGPAFKSSEFAGSGVRLLRGENVEPGRLRWHDTKYWPSDRVEDYERFLVKSGQVILALDRPIISAGLKIAKVRPEDLPCLLVQRVMRFRVVDAALSDYLFVCLREGRFEAVLTGGMTGSDLPHVTGMVVADFTISLPSLNEQREIVRRVEALFQLADVIEKRVGAVTARAAKVTQAILAKAFRGELVPTEADLARREGRGYEPAAELLKRIRAESGGGDMRENRRQRRTAPQGAPKRARPHLGSGA